MSPSPVATLAIVGDVHRCWRPADADYLIRTKPDLAMFVGDLGDEDVDMVREVAQLPVPKAVLLGNHDAWQSCSNNAPTHRLRESLDALGGDHLAYSVRELPQAGISIVGARPFSWGGPNLRGVGVYRQIYDFHTMRQSAVRIVDAARRAQHRDLVILAHNGPLGLGRDSRDIWGKDFGRPGGDWGDRDLAIALERIAAMGLRVRAVVAGHMHHQLVHPRGELRTRFVRRGETWFVNPAVVPRERQYAAGALQSYFVELRLRAGECVGIDELWVDDAGEVCERSTPQFAEAPVQPAEVEVDDGRLADE